MYFVEKLEIDDVIREEIGLIRFSFGCLKFYTMMCEFYYITSINNYYNYFPMKVEVFIIN